MGDPIKLLSSVPTFLASDVAATARWYAEKLEFDTAGHFPDRAPFAFASLQRGNAEIMLLSLENYTKPDIAHLRPSGMWDAYVRMQGVEAMYETVKGSDFVEMELKLQPYGDTEFAVRDPNGYIVVFGGS